jgi:23S rRNA U2552 (ribose-2'-O)-methylase RlmE/FtsJ
MNDLQSYFENNQGRAIFKFPSYFDIYERHFSRFRGQKVTVVEMGVLYGGSLQMWKHYFGKEAMIYGLDINPAFVFEEDQIKVIVANQLDREALQLAMLEIETIDILIDDACHRGNGQITAFEELYPYISENGVYLCEDLGISYREAYGGGLRKEGTFIEYSKNLIDQLNAYHISQGIVPDMFTDTAYGITYYSGVVVIEKRKGCDPRKNRARITGNKSI